MDVFDIMKKYPDRLPVYVKVVGNLPSIDKKKYLVPRNLTVGQFLYVCRKRMTLKPETGIFIFFNNVLASTQTTMEEVYSKYSSPDGLLVATITSENTFGNVIYPL